MKNRHQMIIASKDGHPELDLMSVSRLTCEAVFKDLEESFPVLTIMTYLNEIMKVVKIRYFDCSNWKVSRIKEAMDYCGKLVEHLCGQSNAMVFGSARCSRTG